jgi:D-glycero-D-manno-heptose 1,7-bisphosphate phosphatase
MPLIEPGLWRDIRVPGRRECVPALFLDRDGTLIDLVDYLCDPAEVRLIDRVVETVKEANRAGVAVVVVTNQSGIGRNYYDWDAFEAVQNRVYDLLDGENAFVDAVYACPDLPSGAGGPEMSAFRKPAPGMLLRAADDLGLNLAESRIFGDAATDLAAGKAAGVKTGVLVETGYGARDLDAACALADMEFGVETRFPG